MDVPVKVNLVEVGPRDGFQAVTALYPLEKGRNNPWITRLGLSRIEITSVVSEKAVLQLSDAKRIIHDGNQLSACRSQILVPNLRHAERA